MASAPSAFAARTIRAIRPNVARVILRARLRPSSVSWRRAGSVRSAIAAVARSSATAMITMAIPASSASAGFE
jgi:hypothetical protein